MSRDRYEYADPTDPTDPSDESDRDDPEGSDADDELEDDRDDDPDDDRDDEDPDDRDALDEAFPLGDGTADTAAEIFCPYCGEANEITLDPGGGGAQEYVEDCHVCCRPWRLFVTYLGDGSASVGVEPADGD